MDHLRTDLAPLSGAAWEQVKEEASRTLRTYLAGRALVDVAGPHGWEYSSRSLGRVRPVSGGLPDGVVAGTRVVRPALELRVPFTLDLAELDTIDRGAADPDLSPVTAAAQKAALAEDSAIFSGFAAGGIVGIEEASPHDALTLTTDYDQYPKAVAQAVATLRQAGIGGPYGLALGPRCYTGVIETTEHGGYPLLEHLKLILGGPVVWAPAVNGAVVISLRGGDYSLDLGSDIAIGYTSHDSSSVQLYLEESLTFNVLEDRAAVALKYND
jgi:uncharacterized linocin/CFP29 family protein